MELVAMIFVCGKTGEPREKPSKQGENQQQTKPTYMASGRNQTQFKLWEVSALSSPNAPSLIPCSQLTQTNLAAKKIFFSKKGHFVSLNMRAVLLTTTSYHSFEEGSDAIMFACYYSGSNFNKKETGRGGQRKHAVFVVEFVWPIPQKP